MMETKASTGESCSSGASRLLRCTPAIFESSPLLHTQENKGGLRRVRQDKGKDKGVVSVSWGFSPRRNRQKTVAEEADSNERLKQPGGAIGVVVLGKWCGGGRGRNRGRSGL